MWRASVSTQNLFKHIHLGLYEKSSTLALSGSSPSLILDGFDAVLARWDEADSNDLTSAIINPHAERYDDVNGYRFSFGNISAFIKADPRPFTEPFSLLSLRSGLPCRVVTRQFSTSKELEAMYEIVMGSEKNLNALHRT